MTRRTREGLSLVGGALAFGVAADVLADSVPGRLNVALGLCALVLIAAFLVQRGLVAHAAGRGTPRRAVRAPDGRAHLAGFDHPLRPQPARHRDPRGAGDAGLRAVVWSEAGVLEYPRGALQLAGGAAAGAASLLFNEIDWRSLPDRGPLHRVRAGRSGTALPFHLSRSFSADF